MNFLLEIGCEELPSSFIKKSLVSLKSSLDTLLNKYSLDYQALDCWGTPRRLSVYIQNISSCSPIQLTELKGPPKKVAFDNQGNPTSALLGFIKTNKASMENINIKNISGREYIFLTLQTDSQNSLDILKEHLPDIILSLKTTKAMRWDCPNIFFSRPIRWIVALLDDKVIPFEIGNITSEKISYGHRFFGKAITINNSINYQHLLREGFVIVDRDERKQLIESGLNSVSQKFSAHWQKDEELLDEVTNLVEYPKTLIGRIPEEFLTLPQPLIIATIKHHLRAFPFYDQKDCILPFFVVISNNPSPEASKEIISGYEHVAIARLRDAYFFFHEDIKVPLDTWKNNLRNIAFFQGLGSLGDKNNRLVSTAITCSHLIKEVDPIIFKKTLSLLKFEQSSEVVKEFPELEGIMSKVYALEQRESNQVAQALFEHYLPKSGFDNLPETAMGKWCSILDRIDSLTGIFCTGYKPSGSEDPFSLRRIAIGLIRILINIDQQIDVVPFINSFIEKYRAQGVDVQSSIVSEILTFLQQRLEALWLEEGYRYDVVQAVLGNYFPVNLKLSLKKLIFLENVYEKDSFIDLVLVYKRIQNILKNQNLNLTTPISKNILIEEEEFSLYEAIQLIGNKLPLTPLEEWLDLFSLLGNKVNQFFDKVLVITEDEKIKTNRLLLLSKASEAINNLGDLSFITIRR
ncbi:MAG: Glycine--tRNA ligase beta subunit [candidate division WS2 bacterium]|nr:Glycine--tRNA ligase beta subunit [Candidatus Lithacetigena glycinireducens]